jgi:hypothetical protein
MVDNNIEIENPEDLENEQAAVRMLLAAAQEVLVPAPASPEPIGTVDDLQSLFDQRKQIAQEIEALKQQETETLTTLQQIRGRTAERENQAASLKVKAEKLFEAIFGRPERETPRQLPPQIAKPAALPENLSPENPQSYARIPSLSL